MATSIDDYEVDDSINAKAVFDEVVEYVRSVYGIIGEIAAKELLLSLASLEIQKHPALTYGGRIRRHILLYWPKGWAKSSILIFFKDLIPPQIKVGEETVASSAAFRGSVDNNRQYYPASLIIDDIMLIPELSTMVNGFDTELLGIFLNALEEGRITVSLVKLGNADTSSFEDYPLVEYDTFDKRIRFQTQLVFWAASHTIENISVKHRDAFLDRFIVIQVPAKCLTKELAAQINLSMRSTARERELRGKLNNILKTVNNRLTPDIIKGVHVLASDLVKNDTDGEACHNLRSVNTLAKSGMCYAAYNPNLQEVTQFMRSKIHSYLDKGYTPLEWLIDILSCPPDDEGYTVVELMSLTGRSRASLYRDLGKIRGVRETRKTQIKDGAVGRPLVKYRL